MPSSYKDRLIVRFLIQILIVISVKLSFDRKLSPDSQKLVDEAQQWIEMTQ